MFNSIYKNKRVLVTGHTGFKGSWLCMWLTELGAQVTGYALAPGAQPNHFDGLDIKMTSVIGDLRNAQKLTAAFETSQPEIVFHLAAQASVLVSYQNPVETFSTNVIGTVNVLEACRTTDSVAAVVVVTTDKCYDNKEWVYGYREVDALGGHDPYSSSKACTELVTASYRKSFFATPSKGNCPLVATARAGNVVGGGDWTTDRLVPDAMRAAAQKNQCKSATHTAPDRGSMFWNLYLAICCWAKKWQKDRNNWPKRGILGQHRRPMSRPKNWWISCTGIGLILPVLPPCLLTLHTRLQH